MKILLAVALAAVVIATAAGCGEPEPTGTPGEPGYAGEIAETLLQSLINTADFNAFRELFDTESQKNITEDSFQQTHEEFRSTYGEYSSKEFTGTRENVEEVYTEVSYKAIFKNRPDGVTVKVLFLEKDDKVYASGIFFQEL